MSSEIRAANPDESGTGIAVLIIAITYFTIDGDTPSQVASYGAYGVAIAIFASIICDLQKGLMNLVRIDLVCLGALYGLTFLEFLFPQPAFDIMHSVERTIIGVQICLLGFLGIYFGRHLYKNNHKSTPAFIKKKLPANTLGVLFVLAVLGGFLHQLLAVKFNIFTMLDWWLEDRWARPWGRGKFGGLHTLVYELSLLIYIIPPLAGIIIIKRREFHQLTVSFAVIMLLATLFYGFASGTRTVFSAYMISFSVACSYYLLRERKYKKILILWSIVLPVMFFSITYMLNYRNMGIRNYWIYGDGDQNSLYEEEEKALFVDLNLNNICILSEVFPGLYPYLGFEIPFQSITKPVPRALWPGKPEGFSISIEEACGVAGMTLSCTFMGEAYLSEGELGVFIYGLLFGWLASYFGRFNSPGASDLGTLVFATVAYAFATSMRSMIFFTTALLPTLAIIVYAKWQSMKVKNQ